MEQAPKFKIILSVQEPDGDKRTITIEPLQRLTGDELAKHYEQMLWRMDHPHVPVNAHISKA